MGRFEAIADEFTKAVISCRRLAAADGQQLPGDEVESDGRRAAACWRRRPCFMQCCWRQRHPQPGSMPSGSARSKACSQQRSVATRSALLDKPDSVAAAGGCRASVKDTRPNLLTCTVRAQAVSRSTCQHTLPALIRAPYVLAWLGFVRHQLSRSEGITLMHFVKIGMLVASAPSGTRREPFRRKTSGLNEIENLFGLGDFKGQAAGPVDRVAAWIHAPRSSLTACQMAPVCRATDRAASLAPTGE